MKAFFLTFALLHITVGHEGHGLTMSKQITGDSNTLISKWISQAFINRLEKQMLRGFPVQGQVPMATLLPPIDDPGYLPSLNLPLNFNLSGLFLSSGELSYCTPEVTGLSKVTDDLTVGLIGKVSIKWDFSVPSVAIKGPYKLNQTAESDRLFQKPGAHSLQGEGQLAASVEHVFFKLEATGRAVIGKLHLDTLSVDLGFKNLSGHGDNTSLDGQDMPFDGLVGLLETVFKLVWTNATKPVITEAIRCTINHVVGECTLAQIIGGNLTCLNLSLDLSCFPNSTTPTPLNLTDLDLEMNQAASYCDTFTPTTAETGTASTEPSTPTTAEPSGSSTAVTGGTGSSSTGTSGTASTPTTAQPSGSSTAVTGGTGSSSTGTSGTASTPTTAQPSGSPRLFSQTGLMLATVAFALLLHSPTTV